MSSFVFENIEENCFQVHVAAGRRDGVHYIISYSRLLNFVPFQLVKYPITTHTHTHAHAHTHKSTLALCTQNFSNMGLEKYLGLFTALLSVA